MIGLSVNSNNMKRHSIFFLIGFFTLSLFTAQAQFDSGDKLLNLGIGANSAYRAGIPLHASFEIGINDVISVGAGLDFFAGTEIDAGDRYPYTVFYPAARVSYHFNKIFKLNIEELDIYGGGSVGFRAFAWNSGTPPSNYSSLYGSSIFGSAHVGGRWYFKSTFGVFAEVGIGGSGNARGGIVLRF